MITRYIPHCVLAFGICVGIHSAVNGGGEPDGKEKGGVRAESPSKNSLTADSMGVLHNLIRPQKGEYPWDDIPWYTSIWHARKAAAAEDKPIFVFGTGGAGFNDPLGNC